MGRTFAVLDAGANVINGVAAEWNKSDDYVLKAFCNMPSRGFRKGMVNDAAMATDCVQSIMDKLQQKALAKIQKVYMGVSSPSVSVIHSSGVLLLSKYGREIFQKDIDRCVEMGSTIKMPLDREVLHKIVNGFSVDGEKDINNPLGLEGVKLGVDTSIVTINSSTLHNMAKCISQAGFVPSGFVLSSLASAYRILTSEDTNTGVALINITSDITEVLVLSKGILVDCKVFAMGLDDILNKDAHLDAENMAEATSQIILLEAWNKVRKIALVGQGALLEEVIENLEKVFNCPVEVRSYTVKPLENLPVESTGYVGNLGILDYLRDGRKKQHIDYNVVRGTLSRIAGFVDNYF